MPPIACVADYREKARRRLPRLMFDYIDGGSYAEVTLERNVADLEAIALRQRVMRDVSSLSYEVELFGETLPAPIILAPVGSAGMNARRGEVMAARAAEKAGLPFTLSTVSICSLEEVRAAVSKPFWFQLYMIKDRGYMRQLIARAKAAGCRVLLFTVDLPTMGARYRDVRSGMSAPQTTAVKLNRLLSGIAHLDWALNVGIKGRPHLFGNLVDALPSAKTATDFGAWVVKNFDTTVTWDDIAWVREQWDGPIVVKGVLDPDDARAALAAGADGVVVSNHGGRQLDGVLSSARALPPIVEAVGDRMTVLMDGGVRSGLDVLKALALGAKGVLIGRAWAFALAAEGEAGVQRMLSILRAELRVAMMLTGCTDLKSAGKHLLVE